MLIPQLITKQVRRKERLRQKIMRESVFTLEDIKKLRKEGSKIYFKPGIEGTGEENILDFCLLYAPKDEDKLTTYFQIYRGEYTDYLVSVGVKCVSIKCVSINLLLNLIKLFIKTVIIKYIIDY